MKRLLVTLPFLFCLTIVFIAYSLSEGGIFFNRGASGGGCPNGSSSLGSSVAFQQQAPPVIPDQAPGLKKDITAVKQEIVMARSATNTAMVATAAAGPPAAERRPIFDAKPIRGILGRIFKRR